MANNRRYHLYNDDGVRILEKASGRSVDLELEAHLRGGDVLAVPYDWTLNDRLADLATRRVWPINEKKAVRGRQRYIREYLDVTYPLGELRDAVRLAGELDGVDVLAVGMPLDQVHAFTDHLKQDSRNRAKNPLHNWYRNDRFREQLGKKLGETAARYLDAHLPSARGALVLLDEYTADAFREEYRRGGSQQKSA